MNRYVLWLAALFALRPVAVQAEWMEASSPHFVVYADDSARDLQRFSEQLERYHAAMAMLTGRNVPPPSPSNRVTVYVVRGVGKVRELAGMDDRYLQGFYVPRAGGSLAVVPRVNAGIGVVDMSMIVLLHEYAHHFMIGASSFPMPRWLSEGGAEFFASAAFDADGGISLGRPAQHRAAELYLARDVTAGDLLDPERYEKRGKSSGYDAFYGKSWLLYHYLTFEPARRGQLDRYLLAMATGKSSRDAAQEVFGDFAQLEKDLDAYLKRPRVQMFAIKPSMIQIGRVELRTLSAGEAEMMPVRIRSRRGVNDEQAKAVVADARKVAARYPQDAAVQSALAEAEYDAGNDMAAIDAADKALALDPGQVNAYVQKGFALFRQAGDAKDSSAAYRAARMPFVQLNGREPDHPLPLVYYYRSFVEQGEAPTLLAMQGFERAVELAPFDLGLRMTLAMQQLQLGNHEAARRNLQPIAFNPHGGDLAETARKTITRMDGNPAWRGEGEPAPDASVAADEDDS